VKQRQRLSLVHCSFKEKILSNGVDVILLMDCLKEHINNTTYKQFEKPQGVFKERTLWGAPLFTIDVSQIWILVSLTSAPNGFLLRIRDISVIPPISLTPLGCNFLVISLCFCMLTLDCLTRTDATNETAIVKLSI